MREAASLPPPRFSIVTAVYNVSRYLPDFIDSIDAQGYPSNRMEVIAVDDGSSDDSLEVLRSWAGRAPYRVSVLTKTNGGQSSARNLGLTQARGQWVTFADPDDMLGQGYLHVVDRFLESNPHVEMVATNRIYWEEPTSSLRDGHPLRKHFRSTRVIDLDRFPEFFHGSAPASFLRLDSLRADGLTFDERIRPNFEDGHLCALYLMACETRCVGFVREAEYQYRRRADGSSTLQNSLTDPRRYTVVPDLGYLDLLARAERQYGHVSEWLQNLILYELSWYFSAEDAPSAAATAAVGDVADTFHGLLRSILARIDPEIILAHRVRSLKPVVRDAMLHAWAEGDWHSPYVVAEPVDLDTELVRIVYRYVGAPPDEEFLIRGVPMQPRYAKVRSIRYFDKTVMHERIAWVSGRGTLRVRLAGRPVAIRDRWDPPLPLSRHLLNEAIPAPHPEVEPPEGGLVASVRSRWDKDPIHRAQRAANRARSEFRSAWVLVDRIHDADDSAEILFRHLRATRPDINAWFTVEQGTPDWDRLVKDGYGGRLVAWGSLRWKALLANCAYLISSHIDVPIHQPPDILEFTAPTWRFVFLQHGIIKDDLSNWLNTKKLALFVTSTAAEYASIAGDGTRYVFTTKEVRNTGLPRFDKLLEAGATIPPERRDLVLVTPTWRHWLSPPLAVGSQMRSVREDFWESSYARNWMGLLNSAALREAVLDRGLRLGFLPHPNLQVILNSAELPDHVEPLRFTGVDVRTYFARAAALTTDYSSMAFNAAYLERPVTYFQFDADQMFGGDHVGRGGYYKYERDGFGPVAHDLDSAVQDLVSVLEAGCTAASTYLERIRTAFPQRDGRCCERVIAEIEAVGRRVTRSELATPVPTPVAGT